MESSVQIYHRFPEVAQSACPPVVGTKYHLCRFRVGEALIVAVAVRQSPGYQWVGLDLIVMVKKKMISELKFQYFVGYALLFQLSES